MADLSDCYLIVFTDESGTVHTIPFSKANNGNARANALLKTVQEIGLQGGKYIPDKRN
jgi:hypothetical protein